MTDKIKKYSPCLLVYLVGYLLGSFVGWSFDPADWDGAGRAILMICSTTGAIITAFIIHEKRNV